MSASTRKAVRGIAVATCATALVLGALVPAAYSSPVERTQALNTKAKSLARQINKLCQEPSWASTHRKIAHANVQLLRLNRQTLAVNRVVVRSHEYDSLIVRLLRLDDRVLALDHSGLRLNRRSPVPSSRFAKCLSSLLTAVRAHRKALRRQWEALSPPAGTPVTDYGATGNGVSDDTTAVNSALRAAAKVGGTISFPAGTYKISTVTIPTGVTLVGSGRGSAWLKGRIVLGSNDRLHGIKCGVAGKPFHVVKGAHDSLCQDVVFTGGSSEAAVISLTSSCYNLTFRDCTVESGEWNGITVNDAYGNIHDLTFVGCTVQSQGRMGFECTSRPEVSTSGYYNVTVRNCTFEPQGAEAISFDGGSGAQSCTIDGNVIKGAGINPGWPWGQGLEINGPTSFTVTNNHIYQCRGSLFNLQGTASDSGHVFADNVLDATQSFQTVAMTRESQVIIAFGINGATFARNVVRGGAPGGSVNYLSACSNNDFRTTTWYDARSGYTQPIQVNGSSGNLF